jgi:hypothetical protein
MNTQKISDSVHAVTSALITKRSQSRRSRPSVILTSLAALRTMMAITAAPMP